MSLAPRFVTTVETWFGSVGAAPGPLVYSIYLIPVGYLAYVFGFAVWRGARRFLPFPACAALVLLAMAAVVFRVPAFSHGAASDRPRFSHIAVWVLALGLPALGASAAALSERWPRHVQLPEAPPR